MRLTFVMPTGGLSGGNRVVAIYAQHLAARGHEVHVVWHRLATPRLWRQVVGRLRGRYRSRMQGSAYFDDLEGVTQSIAAEPGPVRATDLPDADVVVATWWETAAPVAALPPEKGAKVYFMQDYGAPGQEIEKLIPTWRMPFVFVTLTQALKRQIAAQNPGAEVIVVANAVDHATYFAPPREKPEVPTLGFMYRRSPSKGIDLAREALRLSRYREALRVIAFGRQTDDLAGWPVAVEYRIDPGDAEVRESYASCTAWLFPSRMEGFGLPILEAMACRTPVVGTRVGAAPDLIRTGVNGALVDVDDPAAMARAIDDLVEMAPQDWQAMSEAAHRTVSGYRWENAAGRFETALAHAARHRSMAVA